MSSTNMTSNRENIAEAAQPLGKPQLAGINVGKNLVTKKTRSALGDIGNSRTGNKIDIPGFKEPTNMKSFKNTGKATGLQPVSKAKVEIRAPENRFRVTTSKPTTSIPGEKASVFDALRQPTRAFGQTGNGSMLLTTSSSYLRQHSASNITVPKIVAEKPYQSQNQNVTVPAVPRKLYSSDVGCGPLATVPECTLIERDVDKVAVAFSEQRLQDVEDIDDAKDSNHIMVTEYINDIMTYMFALEKNYLIDPRYLEGRLINSRMRAVLMDWLVEVHGQYSFTAETLFLCNKLLDRFLLADNTITRADLQLVGVTSLYLAAKYEEVYTPAMRDFSVICDNAFSVTDIRRMESRMLVTLNFDLASPQPCFYLRRFSKAAKADVKLHTLAKYIMELSVVDYSVVDLLPSAVAAAALAIALMILEKKPLRLLWTPTVQYYSTYSLKNIRHPALEMAHVLARAHEEQPKLKAVRTKYGKGKALLRISRIDELHVDNWKQRVMAELLDQH